MKIIILLFLTTIIYGQANNEELYYDDAPDFSMNVVKIDVAPFFYKRGVNFIYERVVFDNNTIGAGVNLLFDEYQFGGLLKQQARKSYGSGYGFQIQWKHFLDDALDGFYSSGILGYKKYNQELRGTLEAWDVKLGVGYQFYIKKALSITLGVDSGYFLINHLNNNNYNGYSAGVSIDAIVGIGYAF